MKIDEVKYELNFVPQSENVNSLMFMVTYNCSMGCPYCRVKQNKTIISKEVYKRAINLLYNSRGKEFTLRFFGGEPLLYPGLIYEIINYSESLRQTYTKKKPKYVITTNGLHLNEDLIKKLNDFNVELMISADGDIQTLNKYRPITDNNHSFEDIFKALALAEKYKIPYFINLLVTPSNVEDLTHNFHYLSKRGAKKIQVCYESGVIWEKNKILRLMDEFTKINSISQRNNIEFMNLNNECEPVIATGEIITDVDGKIYNDISIFHERTFPELRNYVCLGDVFSLTNLQQLFHTKQEFFSKVTQAYANDEKQMKLILNNVKVGLALKDLINNYLSDNSKDTESKSFPKMLKGTVEDQQKFKEQFNLPLKPYFLHIQNNCVNDCIFCKNKKLETTTKELIEFKLKSNLKQGLNKLCLIGNEPLNHPHILETLDLCNSYGFNDIQVMASGMFLKDIDFVKKLKERKVTSFSIPIYSEKEKIHDRIVQRRGDFRDLMDALDNLRKMNMEIFLHTNALKQNIDNLNELENYVLNNITSKFCTLPIRSKTSNLPYRELIPSYTEMIEKLNINTLVGFPLCIIDRIQQKKFLSSDKISDSMKVYLLDQNYVKHKKCKECKYKPRCPGFFREYAKIYGVNEIKPFENE